VLPPQLTLEETEDFDDDIAHRFDGDQTGSWKVNSGRYESTAAAGVPSIDTIRFTETENLQPNSYLDLQATLRTTAIGGIVLTRMRRTISSSSRSDVTGQKVIVGHWEPNRGYVIDASVAKTLSSDTDYTLSVTMKGASVSVTLNGSFVLSWGFNAAIVNGAFGVLSQNGTTSFDSFRIRTNDPAFAPARAGRTSWQLRRVRRWREAGARSRQRI